MRFQKDSVCADMTDFPADVGRPWKVRDKRGKMRLRARVIGCEMIAERRTCKTNKHRTHENMLLNVWRPDGVVR